MPRVAVVSDTTGYLPPDLAGSSGIHLVSLYVNYDTGRVEREADIPDLHAFYDDLRSAERLPTTSEPSIEDFVAAYEPLLVEGHEVVSIHISDALSRTCGVARAAAERLERDGRGGERVRVVDTGTAAAGVAVLSLVGARRAAAGEDADSVIRQVGEAREAWKMWGCLDTVEFLRRGGRIGGLTAWVGSTLRVKPIVTVESEIQPVERVRTAHRALERMVDYARQRHASGADAWVVQHGQWPDEAAELADRCRDLFGTAPVFLSQIGPVLGVYTGPGVLAVGALPARFLT